jgi:tRNA dimethylallyltransferase
MNIGTAKPTKEELARVPHHLIDICEPSERMDIARYVTMARETVHGILSRGRRVLVTGGSGFYLKAFLAPVVDGITVSEEIRKRVEEMSLPEAVTTLKELNPDGLGTLDRDNPRRVTRALERCLASGKTLLQLRAEFVAQPSAFADYEFKLVELVRDPEILAQRISHRVDAMLTAGLVTEVEQLLPMRLAANPSGAFSIGYREVIAMLAGELPSERLAEKIAQNTRALVKKQRTWFRTQIPEHRTVDAASATPADLFPED